MGKIKIGGGVYMGGGGGIFLLGGVSKFLANGGNQETYNREEPVNSVMS